MAENIAIQALMRAMEENAREAAELTEALEVLQDRYGTDDEPERPRLIIRPKSRFKLLDRVVTVSGLAGYIEDKVWVSSADASEESHWRYRVKYNPATVNPVGTLAGSWPEHTLTLAGRDNEQSGS
jgi:hypothetical protein